MKKLAVFVEGQTEQIVVENLLLEIAGRKNIRIETLQGAGAVGRRHFRILKASAQSGAKYYAQIYDSRGEDNVKSDVVDRYAGLVAANFTSIIAIRDVLPKFSYADIPKLRAGLMMYVRTAPLKPLFVLSIMETEAWFLSEHTHFQRIHQNLTPQLIKSRLGFDPSCEDMELRAQPAQDLNNAYSLVGLAYRKNRAQVERTVRVLSYEHCYLDLPNRHPDVKALVGAIDTFLS